MIHSIFKDTEKLEYLYQILLFLISKHLGLGSGNKKKKTTEALPYYGEFLSDCIIWVLFLNFN